MREPGRRDEGDTQRDGGGKPSSLRAVLDALRGIPERMKRPESMLMILMIMASIGAHMPPYLSLGALADYFKEKEKEQAAHKEPPVTFEVLDDKPKEPEPPPKPRTPKERQAQKLEEKKKKAEEVKKAAEEKKQVVEITPPKPEAPPPPPVKPRDDRKQSITQKSQDPSVEPPPDTKFLAEENQRVEEETVASVTSETKNDPNPQAAAPQAAGPEKSGDSHSDERGAEKGQKAEQQQRAASRQHSQENNPRPPEPAGGQAQGTAKPGPMAPSVTAPREQIFHDPLGSFTLAASDPNVAPAGGAMGSGAAGNASKIKVSWHAFEQTFGAEQLAQDRMPKEAKRRGAGREKRWEEFRASIENYVVGVKPGNTTKLNAAADPFAAYLAAFHRNLHIEFAHDFLNSLPAAGDLANPALVTMVEIVINADGSLDRVGVVKASGNLMYDFGAFNAVQRGAPYPPTPEKIRSPDGRVYIKWALHRNESQCGTWNAEPYILKNPPRSPNDPKQDNVSPYNPGETGQGGGTNKGGTPGKAPVVTPDETLGLVDDPLSRPRSRLDPRLALARG